MATTAGDALLAYLAEQLAELRLHAPGVRKNQGESIHKMRVAARRMRSLLASGSKLLADGTAKNLRTELRWLSGMLGPARDPAVVQARLRELLTAEPEGLVLGEAPARIDEKLEASAADGFKGALEALDGERFAQLLNSFEAWLNAGSLSEKASRPPRKTIRKLVAKDEQRLRRVVEGLPPPDDSAARDQALHEVRKTAKRLRYSAELAESLGGGGAKGARRTAKAARRIQTDLGQHQDSVVARTLLAELGHQALGSGEDGFTYGRLHAKEEQLAASAEADFLKAWRKFAG
ncbi:MAG: CHAD domain-containing protein [Arthrobacter sp.]